MNTKTAALVAWVFGVALSSTAQDLPEAMVTLKVLDEQGQPIAGANAGVTFEFVGPDGKSMSKPVEGVTDGGGQFSATARTIPSFFYGADKLGYYRTFQGYNFTVKPQNGRWQPWNPTLAVVLKKIINPVPMYAKRVRTDIPLENRRIGFDLEEADWVAPFGRGKVSDFVFALTKRFASLDDYEGTLALSFSNKDDGIQEIIASHRVGSELRLPHLAPETGYRDALTVLRGTTPGKKYLGELNEDRNFVFRVRTVSQGETVGRAMYGKIHSDIRLSVWKERAAIGFTYYLNPDGTRNLEFDPKRNLFNDLKPREQVQHP